MTEFLTFQGVSKSFPGVRALDGVGFAVPRGSVHGLLGENGAGKSTLIKILAGVVAPDTATIAIDDEPVTIDSPAAAHRLGLRFIHQELYVVPALSVAENIVIAQRYPTRAGILVDWPRVNTMARDALARLGITHIDPRVKMAQLTVGDRMLVKIAD